MLGRADLDSRGCVTLADLSRYVTDNVIAWWAVHGTTTQSGLQTPHVSATHAHQIVLSGNRRLVPERPTRADTPSLSAEAGLPLAVRVWMQAAAAPCRTPSDGVAPQPRLADPAFVEGQAVRFGFWVSQDAYLYLLYVDAEGTVSLTFPRDDWQENHVGGKQLSFLPQEADAEPALPLLGPPGTVRLMAIATSQPVPMFTEAQLEDADALSAAELMRWEHALTGLPRGQWAVGQFQFVVRKQE